ncbi:Prolipoprotein diacylglyceryl transferase [Arboricoccus pini]|uniref:Phosphatidylglycerol--prolipoprotein diacylglyceryl transferase n=1 Tax=Arboricoccus pini TaxID=1963835 RepID=A0A212S1Y9_9PROT|nr:prolipoprotein diacylglyceryl transferase [Arboricoccus pini]SNB79083.1 Prolipoprotein diacylglyceryl transferase [Arboricoccus pini]
MLTALPFPMIDPIAVHIWGPLALRWYALAYIAGLVLGWLYVRQLTKRPRWRLQPEAIDDLLFYCTLGVILGGRIGYILFYNLEHYISEPLDILFVWHGGMSFHGGLIGVLLGALIFAQRQRLYFLEVTDALAVATPIGLFFGRIANFINGELWGRPADVPWAMIFPTGGDIPRHPSQIYEALLEGLVLFIVMMIASRRTYLLEERGRLGGIFLTGYGLARIVCEFFREPDAQLGFLWGGATMGQLLSIPMVLAGICLILRAHRRPPQPA